MAFQYGAVGSVEHECTVYFILTKVKQTNEDNLNFIRTFSSNVQKAK